MTKRFTYRDYDDGTQSIYDKENDDFYFDSDIEELCVLLNNLNEENKKLKEENKDLVSQNKSSQYIIEKLKKCYNNVLDEMDDLAEIHDRENDLSFQTIDGLLNRLYDADIGVLIEESVSERLEKWKRSCQND